MSLHSDPEKGPMDEKLSDTQHVDKSDRPLKFDKTGLPLVPQPSDDPSDPLNWPLRTKIGLLLLVSFIASNTPWALAVANPAFREIANYFGYAEPVEGGYPSTVGIATAGIGGFFWLPFASVYGRRPVYLVSLAIATAAGAGSAVCDQFGLLILARAISGFALAAGPGIGAGVVADLFFLHERGRATGIFTVILTNGPHIASLPGGYLAQYVGFRWTFWLPAITTGFLFLLTLFFYPETLYIRTPDAVHRDVGHHPVRTALFSLPRRATGRRINFASFYRPIFLLKYWTISILCLYYSVVFTFGSILPALTVSKSFSQFYGFKAGRIGLCLSLSTTIGGVLGELVAGPVIDRQLHAARAKHGGNAPPETRLWGLLPGVFLLPAGLLIFGFSIHNFRTTSYIGSCCGMALTCFAVQVVTTPTYAYLFDVYKPQAAEVAQLVNMARQTLACTVGFWASRFGDKVGYDMAGVTYACISLAFFLPVAYVMARGQQLRERQGTPTFNKGV